MESESLLLVVVLLLVILLIVLIAVVVVFGFRLLKIQNSKNNESTVQTNGLYEKYQIPDEVKSLIENSKKTEEQNQNINEHFCVDHPEILAKGICAISSENLCELCLTKEDDIKIGRKYLNTYLDNSWTDLEMIRHTSENSSLISQIESLKKNLWDENQTPIIMQKQFKIDIDTDIIETYTLVKVIESDADSIRNSLQS